MDVGLFSSIVNHQDVCEGQPSFIPQEKEIKSLLPNESHLRNNHKGSQESLEEPLRESQVFSMTMSKEDLTKEGSCPQKPSTRLKELSKIPLLLSSPKNGISFRGDQEMNSPLLSDKNPNPSGNSQEKGYDSELPTIGWIDNTVPDVTPVSIPKLPAKPFVILEDKDKPAEETLQKVSRSQKELLSLQSLPGQAQLKASERVQDREEDLSYNPGLLELLKDNTLQAPEKDDSYPAYRERPQDMASSGPLQSAKGPLNNLHSRDQAFRQISIEGFDSPSKKNPLINSGGTTPSDTTNLPINSPALNFTNFNTLREKEKPVQNPSILKYLPSRKDSFVENPSKLRSDFSDFKTAFLPTRSKSTDRAELARMDKTPPKRSNALSVINECEETRGNQIGDSARTIEEISRLVSGTGDNVYPFSKLLTQVAENEQEAEETSEQKIDYYEGFEGIEGGYEGVEGSGRENVERSPIQIQSKASANDSYKKTLKGSDSSGFSPLSKKLSKRDSRFKTPLAE